VLLYSPVRNVNYPNSTSHFRCYEKFLLVFSLLVYNMLRTDEKKRFDVLLDILSCMKLLCFESLCQDSYHFAVFHSSSKRMHAGTETSASLTNYLFK
jgi:hypothetical protein